MKALAEKWLRLAAAALPPTWLKGTAANASPPLFVQPRRHRRSPPSLAPPAPWQSPRELEAVLRLFRDLAPSHVLEIGTAQGGTLWHWLQNAPPGAIVVSLDLPKSGKAETDVFRTWIPDGVTLHCLTGDSHHPDSLAAVRMHLSSIDFLFIDGDHSYNGVRSDFEMYGALVRAGGIIAIHDIAPNGPGSHIEVPKFWAEVKQQDLAIEEFIERPWGLRYGIGVVHV